MATKEQVKKCIETIAPLAQAEFSKGKAILPCVCIAQACLESGYFTATKMINANAVFGIKVGKSKVHFGDAWKDKAYDSATKEFYNGAYTNITAMFRAYDSIADSVTDYYDMLTSCNRYKKAVGETDYKKAIQAIKDGGYATSPTYVNTIVSIIEKNNLTQYDNVKAPEANTIEKEAPEEKEVAPEYKVGSVYTLQRNMYVREAPNGSNVKYQNLTADGKKHASKDVEGNAILLKGTRVTCKQMKIISGATWIRIPSKWICAVGSKGTVYVK